MGNDGERLGDPANVLPDAPSEALPEFAGTERYEVVRFLGAGAMGVVYEAFDRERKTSIALKTIRSVDAQAIYYLKREFRAIADLVHPNLVRLHELVFGGGRWFFTMDLIEGRDFLSHVRGGAAAGSAEQTRRPDLAALRPALLQLVTGVAALHDHGKLHRDIKPSNALVARDGRVVLMDFGLLVEPNTPDPYRTYDRGLVGTPAYLAPEQAMTPARTSAASDWYSVGVLLYEVLTGSVPYLAESRSIADLLAAKQSRPPPPPSALAPSVAGDLDALCMELLAIDPELRPTGPEILRRLGATVAPPRAAPVAAPARGLLVGRDAQLAQLEEAFAHVRRGQAVVAFIEGTSGTGKTALLEHFAGLLADRGEAVVISGRCLERELLPYRALDNLVDTLTRYLVALPAHEVETILPRDIQALARLFPVLRRVPAIGGARRRGETAAPDPQELRQRAFGAMRDLLGRIADRRPLVLCVDDLQWGDVDSATLIRAVLRAPAPPPILAIASYRSEDAETSACLQVLSDLALEGGEDGGPDRAQRVHVNVDSLGEGDARQLARALLAAREPADPAAETIARESGGNPLLLHQLVDHLNSQPGGERAAPRAALTLDDVLRERVGDLPANARALLEVVAVAGRPIALEIGNEVAGLAAGDREAVSTLRSQRLARTKDGERTLEIVHDRIRQSVAAQIAPETVTRCHRRLAVALEGRPEVDPEILASHFFGGGDLERASEYAAAAADRANQALAFERAARLYRWAIDLRTPKDANASAEVRALLVKQGDALANAGKGAAAAESFLAAARGAAANDEVEYRRRAAEQYLKSGHIDESMEILRTTLAVFGVGLARTPRRALWSLIYRRAVLALRGLSSRERDPSLVTARELTRLDVLWSLSAGFGIIDTIRAADLQTRHLLLALKLGNPYRIARALTFEAAFSATPGKRAHRRTTRLVKLSEEIAARVNQPYTQGWAVLARGMVAFMEGEHRPARADCEKAEEIFRSNCTGVAHEINIARLFGLFAMFYLGDFAELSRRVPRLLKEAEDNGDLYLATSLRTGLCNSYWLAADDPDGGRQQVAEGMRRWTKRSFHNQHYFNMSAEAHIDLYQGDPATARTRVLSNWHKLESALILRIQTARVQSLGLRGRCSLALAATKQGHERRALLATAEADATLLEREGLDATTPQAALLRAGACALRQDAVGARARLERAAGGLRRRGHEGLRVGQPAAARRAHRRRRRTRPRRARGRVAARRGDPESRSLHRAVRARVRRVYCVTMRACSAP